MAKERKFYAFLGLQTSTQPRNPEYFPEFPICHDSASSQIFLANIQEVTNYRRHFMFFAKFYPVSLKNIPVKI